MEAKEDEEDEEILLDRFLDVEACDPRQLHDVGPGRQRLAGSIESTARDRPRPWPPATKPPSAG